MGVCFPGADAAMLLYDAASRLKLRPGPAGDKQLPATLGNGAIAQGH
jgi:hypothetical protein